MNSHSTSRRRFLTYLGGLTAFSLSGCGRETQSPLEGLERPLQLLSRRLSGPVLEPGQQGYLQRALPWNLRFAKVLPAGVAVCQSSADVREALLWAQAYGVPLAVRSGGHSFAGFSTTEGLMIDVSSLNQVEFDAASGKVRMAGGVRNSGARATLLQVDAAITHGRCVGVGVSGLTLGGGIGFSMRSKGLTCDRLLETEIVTASGEILTCNADSNSDLFWACRGGGGGNFGINTSMTFQAFPVDQVTVFQVEWNSKPEEVLAALLRLGPSAPEQLGMLAAAEVTPGKAPSIFLLGQFYGSPQELRTILDPIFQIAAPITEDIHQDKYWDAQTFLAEEGRPEYLQESSRYAYSDISNQAIGAIFAALRRWPGQTGSGTWNFFLTGGQVDRVGRTDTAYCHRGARLLTTCTVSWDSSLSAEAEAANLEWQQAFHLEMAQYTSAESFQNFVDRNQANYLQAYYGENLERLVQVKRRYDPANVFQFPQSLPTQLHLLGGEPGSVC